MCRSLFKIERSGVEEAISVLGAWLDIAGTSANECKQSRHTGTNQEAVNSV